MKIVKRDGRLVEFDATKIMNAIMKAFYEVDGENKEESLIKAVDIAKKIAAMEGEIFTVEEIQDIVERKLMASSRKDVAKAYILYREERSKARERNSAFNRELTDKIYASKVENQNANVDEKSFGGRIGAASSALLKKYALDNIVSEMARNNHLNNEVYIHDLDHYAVGDHNCLTIPFDHLLENGFNTRQTDVRPAQSVNTAFQLVAVIFQLQSLQQFGGVSAGHLDWTMVPYVRKSFYKHFSDGIFYVERIIAMDDRLGGHLSIEDPAYKEYPRAYDYAMAMTIKEVRQACEAMYHNLNYWATRQ